MTPGERRLLTVRREERFGSLVAAAGVIWGIYIATKDYDSLWHFQINPPGPLEVCALGILAWLHAKWRRSLKV
jgi:disulfide bond formation protein DsbB